MKVSEIIEILEEMDPDATVLVMSQSAWPFELDWVQILLVHTLRSPNSHIIP